jgi:hypothetical protein
MITFKQFLRENAGEDWHSYLNAVKGTKYNLLAHQTMAETADKIMRSENFGADNGIVGTSLFTNNEELQSTIDAMKGRDEGDTNNWGRVHRGSNAILLMATPRVIGGQRIRTLDDLEGVLVDLSAEDILPDIKIPNQNIIGYLKSDGTLVKNPKFSPENSPLNR